MSLFKVIIFLLIVSTVLVDSRTRRKRHQDLRSSAYYGSTGVSNSQNLAYALSLAGFGNSLYPIGNNWYVPNNLPYPYNDPFSYNMPQQPFIGSNEYPNAYNTYWTGGQNGVSSFNGQYPTNSQAYVGQSYVPANNEWLPLPGINRRQQLRRSAIISKTDNNPGRSTSK